MSGECGKRQRERGRRSEMRETEEQTIRKAERCERGKCSYNLVLKFINSFPPNLSSQANYFNWTKEQTTCFPFAFSLQYFKIPTLSLVIHRLWRLPSISLLPTFSAQIFLISSYTPINPLFWPIYQYLGHRVKAIFTFDFMGLQNRNKTNSSSL